MIQIALSALSADRNYKSECGGEEFTMQKTRFGISVGLMGAAIYFVGLFGGYAAMLLLAGDVLLFGENG